MKSLYRLMGLLVCTLSFSCVDPIDIDTGTGESQMVVDGTVVFDSDHPNRKDTITLSKSVDYNDNISKPYVDNAFLTITDSDGFIDTLLHTQKGKYVTQKLQTAIGKTYTLKLITAEGEIYTATSNIKRLANFVGLKTVDTTRTTGPGGAVPAGGYVLLLASDLVGENDCYRFKTYVKRNQDNNSPYWQKNKNPNWILYGEARNLNIGIDALSADNNINGGLDGTPFSLPVRVQINTVEETPRNYPAYYPGDSIKLEIYSITKDHLTFYYRLKQELTNGTGGGFAGLFARPTANIPSNIINTNPNSKNVALGWFGAASMVSRSTRMLPFDFKKAPSL